MKKYLIISTLLLLSSFVSCQKGLESDVEIASTSLVAKSFSVSAPETKTSLDGKTVKWADGDMIKVIGVTTDGVVGQYDFELTGGAGSKNASFSGEVGANDVTFYAIYPNLSINPDEKDYTLASGVLAIANESSLPKTQKAFVNAFDPGFGIMTAVADEDGNLAFRYGMGFFKFVMGVENVKMVTFSTTGNIRFGRRPAYSISDGSVKQVNSAAKTIDLVPSEGNVFIKGATYYLAFPPKQSTTGDLTITYTNTDDKTASLTTEAFASIKLQPGVIYNIGCPPISFSPIIKASDPSKLEFDATSGSFSYVIDNPIEGQTATATLTEGNWISNVQVGDDTVTFDCEANDTEEERSAVITLSYEGAEDVVVNVKQRAASSSTSENYIWDFSTSGWQSALDAQAPEAKDTKASNWSVSYDNLSYTAGSDDRWSVNGYIQPNGSGYYKSETNKRRYFLFTTSGPGFVYVTVISNSSSEKTADICAQIGFKSDADFKVSTTAGSTSVTKELGHFTDGGDIAVFLGASGLRIQKIEFHTDQQ